MKTTCLYYKCNNYSVAQSLCKRHYNKVFYRMKKKALSFKEALFELITEKKEKECT